MSKKNKNSRRKTEASDFFVSAEVEGEGEGGETMPDGATQDQPATNHRATFHQSNFDQSQGDNSPIRF
jgi:hypothetical protein